MTNAKDLGNEIDRRAERIDQAIERVLAASTNNFGELALIAGLDLATDFRFSNLADVDLSDCPLELFDFTGACLDGVTYDLASAAQKNSKALHSILPLPTKDGAEAEARQVGRAANWYEAMLNDVDALLEVTVGDKRWFMGSLRDIRVFYVRGIEWFENTFPQLAENTVERHVELMKQLLDERQRRWKDGRLDFNAKYSQENFDDAREGIACTFQVAVETILLCEAAMRSDGGRGGASIYQHMSIEPALCYIPNFDRSVVESFTAQEFGELVSTTGQQSERLIWDMASGATATYRVVKRIHDYLMLKELKGFGTPKTWTPSLGNRPRPTRYEWFRPSRLT